VAENQDGYGRVEMSHYHDGLTGVDVTEIMLLGGIASQLRMLDPRYAVHGAETDYRAAETDRGGASARALGQTAPTGCAIGEDTAGIIVGGLLTLLAGLFGAILLG
jgi:hypothetical protein